MNPLPSHTNQDTPAAPKYAGLLILLFFVFILGWNVGVHHNEVQQQKINRENIGPGVDSSLRQVDMGLFWDVWEILNNKYVDPAALDYNEMLDGSIHGLVGALGDEYTAYLNPKENREFQDYIGGTLEGIGAELTIKNNQLTVVSPLKGSPASKAGLQPGDVIHKIDGAAAEEFTLEQAVLKIRGARGTKVTLTILREGVAEPLDISIIRRTIQIDSVDWRTEKGVAIIEINQFGDKTQEEFSKAISEVLNNSPDGLVLDLRFNGGGYLDGAVMITSEFVEKGKVVAIKKRNPTEDEVIYVNGKARVTNLPMVVLINKGSASASEIVAGALQDHKRAYVIGEQSFGKGTVQEVENLLGGSSLRYTIAKWYTPENRNISEVGITPDSTVERDSEDFQSDRDPQLEAAIEYLKKTAKGVQ